MINSLQRITTKISGPSAAKKRLLACTVLSVVLYAAPAWSKALKYNFYCSKLERVSRRLSICIIAAYRTAPTTALQTLAGLPPIDLLVKERTHIQEYGKDKKSEAREQLLNSWQER